MDIKDKKIEDFVEQMLKFQEDSKNKALSTNDLKEVAMSVGIQEFEWEEMQAAAKADIIVARKHFGFGNYDDAFDTAKKVLVMNPSNLDALEIMSNSALRLYQTQGNQKHRHYAEKYANEALQYSPNENWAFKVLADIDNVEFAHKENSKKKIKNIVIIAVVAVLSIVGIILTATVFSKSGNKNRKHDMIEAKENAKAQWAQVENVMNRRDQLIPELIVIADMNKVDYKKTLDELNTIKNDLKNVDYKQKLDLQLKLQEKTRELTKIISENIDSKSVRELMIQIEGTYNRISVETKYYNEAVREYNIMVQKYADDFPEFKQMPYYGEK